MDLPLFFRINHSSGFRSGNLNGSTLRDSIAFCQTYYLNLDRGQSTGSTTYLVIYNLSL